MYSLNVPVPGPVRAIAWDLRADLLGLERLRDELTLVVKRLDARSAGEFAAVERAVRQELQGTSPFEVRITGLEAFTDPPAGPAPVVYLAIDGPELVALHRRLVERFGTEGPIEGAGYRPHITLGRGTAEPGAIDDMLATEVGDHRWTVDRLVFWDARRALPAGDVALPA